MYFCILLALGLVIVLVQIWDCGRLYMQLDVPTLILLLLLFLAAMFATKAAKKLAAGFGYVFFEKENNRKENTVPLLAYKECLEAVRFAMKTLLISGSLISVLNLYSFTQVEETAQIIVMLEVSFCGILYGLIGCFMLLPVYYRLKILIMQYVPDDVELEERLEERSEKAYFKLRGMGLTTREAEVGKLIVCQKLSNKEIADELLISESTVKRHVTHILEKLEITGREEIAMRIKKEEIGGNLNGTEERGDESAGYIEKLREKESPR